MLKSWQYYVGFFVWFPFTIGCGIFSIPYIILRFFAPRIKTKKELNNFITQWKNILEMNKLRITGDFISSSFSSHVETIKRGYEYSIFIKSGFLDCRSPVIIHELLHIKKKHLDLLHEPHFLRLVLCNIIYDTVVNIELLKYAHEILNHKIIKNKIKI